MARRTPGMLALGCWLLLCCTVTGQTYNSAEHVQNLYRKYLNREPTTNELTQWVWSFQKGLSLTDAQATFLSSDEYYGRYGQNPDLFITGLFKDVLNRPPTADESVQWRHSLSVAQGNRAKIVASFLKASAGHTPAATPPPRPDPVATETQLVATASLLHGAIEEELGGTQQGRSLTVMSRNLVNASRSLERAKEATPAVYQQAITDVGSAMSAIEQQMSQLHFSAQDSSAFLARFKKLYATLVPSTTTTMVPLPDVPQPAPANVSVELYNQFIQLSTTMLSDTNQVIFLFRNSPTLDADGSQLMRDVEFFLSQAQSIHQNASIGMLKQDLRHEILRLRALSQGVTHSMQRTGQLGRVAQRWEIVAQDLQHIGELVGIAAGPVIDPGQPVMLNLVTYHQFPYQVQRPTTAQLSIQAIPFTDQAIAHVDAFVIGFNRFLPLSPRVPALQSQARGLRVLLTQFRQELAAGTSPQMLKGRLVQINQSLQAVSLQWTRTVQERQLSNTPDLSGVMSSIQSLNQIFQGV